MIDKSIVKNLVDQWLEDKDYFLVDIEISSDNKIVVEIDHADGVWIEDCVELSRFIEDHLDREQEDYELEVGSAGLGQPFKVEPVTTEEKVKVEGKKRPQLQEVDHEFTMDGVKYCKYLISFK